MAETGNEVFSADVHVEYERSTARDKYDNIVDRGESRDLGKFKISAKTLEDLKKKLHAHIDLLE